MSDMKEYQNQLHNWEEELAYCESEVVDFIKLHLERLTLPGYFTEYLEEDFFDLERESFIYACDIYRHGFEILS